MCLYNINHFGYEYPPDYIKIAYKVFFIHGGDLYFPYYTPDGKPKSGIYFGTVNEIEKDKWLKASNSRIDATVYSLTSDSMPKDYKSGFHCFVNESDAKLYQRDISSSAIIVPVKIRDIHTSGFTAVYNERYNQELLFTLVAGEMLVPSESVNGQ